VPWWPLASCGDALEKKPTDIVLAKVETTLEFLLQALQRLENKIEPPKN